MQTAKGQGMDKFDVVIVPKTGWLDINFQELWKYRDLISLFVKRNFISQYKQTILGPAWAIVQPLLTTVFFTVIFGTMAGLSAEGVPSFLFYMSGTIAWTYFSSCLTNTADTFTKNASILGKSLFSQAGDADLNCFDQPHFSIHSISDVPVFSYLLLGKRAGSSE